ncbi:MAG TPA: hypothetical protein VMV92_04360, partial [Streptosporangiaceae bacterium]|nr:hypothetical protein [Streptosporangiaceae bacterium]
MYLTGDPGVTAVPAHSLGPHRRRALYLCLPLDVTLCITIGRGLAGHPATMINYFRTDEQTWS